MWKAVLALLVLSDAASGLQIGVASRGVRLASAPQRRTTGPQAQFGGQDKGSKGLSRDEEPEEFFATNMGEPLRATFWRRAGRAYSCCEPAVPAPL